VESASVPAQAVQPQEDEDTLKAGAIGFIDAKSAIDLSDPENSYTGQTWLGVGPPLVVGVGFLLLGVVLMILWRLFGRHERYFTPKPFEAVDPDVASGLVTVAAVDELA
jgi:hypothetical protein